jgi:hypothetical protein
MDDRSCQGAQILNRPPNQGKRTDCYERELDPLLQLGFALLTFLINLLLMQPLMKSLRTQFDPIRLSG